MCEKSELWNMFKLLHYYNGDFDIVRAFNLDIALISIYLYTYIYIYVYICMSI